MQPDTWSVAKKLAGLEEQPQRANGNGNGHVQAHTLARSGLTDLANAQRLAQRHGHELCYARGLGWFVWDGRRWVRDETGEVERRAKETAISILEEAAACTDDQARAALVKHQRASESTLRLRAMIEVAQTEPGIFVTAGAFDSNPALFNCLNGTLNLVTGELQEHDPHDLITKLAPVEFDPEARLDEWDDFLRAVTNEDADYAAFLQRAVGYSLSGHTHEEKLFFVFGPAATGKSTFLESIKAMLGDYATTSDFETFLQRSFVGGPRNDIARLKGARFVSSIEVEEGKKLAEGLVKNLTGGDTVAARFLHKEAFEFTPQFKLWLCANHAPKVRDDDDAMWRRILRLPFDQVIPEGERKADVKLRLRDPSLSGTAILAWAFTGYRMWQQRGLAVPLRVKKSTEEYQQENNSLGEFLTECCVLGGENVVRANDLRTMYEKWAGPDALTRKEFTARLRGMGCSSTWIGPEQHRGWKGIGLLGLNNQTTDVKE